MTYCNKVKMPILVVLVTVVFADGQIVKAETKKKVTDWNSPSLSFFYNEQSKADLIKSLSEWDVQPMMWPTEEEIDNYRGVATESQKEECLKEIKNCLKDEWIPDEIASYLLPLKKWAKPNEHWVEKGKADVFLCRYCSGNYMIQIMDGRWAMIITIKDITDIPPLTKADRQNFVSNMFRTFWKGEMSNMRLAERQYENIITGGIKFGDKWVSFLTDGKMVKFKLTKILQGPRTFPDPYEPRFSDTQKSK